MRRSADKRGRSAVIAVTRFRYCVLLTPSVRIQLRAEIPFDGSSRRDGRLPMHFPPAIVPGSAGFPQRPEGISREGRRRYRTPFRRIHFVRKSLSRVFGMSASSVLSVKTFPRVASRRFFMSSLRTPNPLPAMHAMTSYLGEPFGLPTILKAPRC